MTTVPDLQVSERLPHMAKEMHHCGLIRSMRHRNRLHGSGSIETHTGRQAAQGVREEFAPIPQFFPCHGAAMIYWRFGFDPKQLISDRTGRPWRFADGEPIKNFFAA